MHWRAVSDARALSAVCTVSDGQISPFQISCLKCDVCVSPRALLKMKITDSVTSYGFTTVA